MFNNEPCFEEVFQADALDDLGSPMRYYPRLARLLGCNGRPCVHRALIVAQIDYWVQKNREDGRNMVNGRYWTYNSFEKWGAELGMSAKTFQRHMRELEKQGIIIRGRYNKKRWDRTTWYTIDYQKLGYLVKCYRATKGGALVQNVQMDGDGTTSPIPDNSQRLPEEDCFIERKVEEEGRKADHPLDAETLKEVGCLVKSLGAQGATKELTPLYGKEAERKVMMAIYMGN